MNRINRTTLTKHTSASHSVQIVIRNHVVSQIVFSPLIKLNVILREWTDDRIIYRCFLTMRIDFITIFTVDLFWIKAHAENRFHFFLFSPLRIFVFVASNKILWKVYQCSQKYRSPECSSSYTYAEVKGNRRSGPIPPITEFQTCYTPCFRRQIGYYLFLSICSRCFHFSHCISPYGIASHIR